MYGYLLYTTFCFSFVWLESGEGSSPSRDGGRSLGDRLLKLPSLLYAASQVDNLLYLPSLLYAACKEDNLLYLPSLLYAASKVDNLLYLPSLLYAASKVDNLLYLPSLLYSSLTAIGFVSGVIRGGQKTKKRLRAICFLYFCHLRK